MLTPNTILFGKVFSEKSIPFVLVPVLDKCMFDFQRLYTLTFSYFQSQTEQNSKDF